MCVEVENNSFNIYYLYLKRDREKEKGGAAGGGSSLDTLDPMDPLVVHK